MKKFLDTEKVENFFCHRCWHGAALKYLSVIGAAEVIKFLSFNRDCTFPLYLLYVSYLTRVYLNWFLSDRYRKTQELWQR